MKKALIIVISLISIIGFSATVSAWQIELGDAYDFSGYSAYDIIFSGDETDNLNNINLSIGYDINDVTFTTVQYYDYDDGGFPVANDAWIGNMIPNTNDTDLGLLYNVQGQEPLGTSGLFYPEATGSTLLFTLFFEEFGGGNLDDSSVYFTYGSDLTVLAVEAVNINGERNNNHELTITADTITAVPVPAAGWLLVSGLFGLVGVRRRQVKK